MSLRKIAIIGARITGQAGVVLDLLSQIGGYEVVGFLDSTPELLGKKVAGIKVLGSPDDLSSIKDKFDAVHIAIGDNVARLKIARSVIEHGLTLETLVHPGAYVASDTLLGAGTYVGASSIVNTGARLGIACLINSGAIVEHDNKIGDGVHFGPGSCSTGRVEVGECTFIGAGATIIPDIKIGDFALIGAGSVVVKDVTDKTTMIGYAAKKKKQTVYYEHDDAGVSSELSNLTTDEQLLLKSLLRKIGN